MKEINCIGDFCPVPILKVKKALENCKPGENFTVIADHDCVRESIEEYLDRKNFSYIVTELENGIFEISITENS